MSPLFPAKLALLHLDTQAFSPYNDNTYFFRRKFLQNFEKGGRCTLSHGRGRYGAPMNRHFSLTAGLAAGLLALLCACTPTQPTVSNSAGQASGQTPPPQTAPLQSTAQVSDAPVVSPSGTPASDVPVSEAPASGGGVLSSFTAQDLSGNEVDQSIFAGHKLTMVNIWATFCGPCLSEMPELGEIHAQYADKGVQVVGIVTDVLNQDGSYNEAQIATARDAVSLTGADYLHLLPSPDLIVNKLQFVTAVPETIFVDSQGNQVGESYLGAKSKDQWTAIIDELLAQVED